MAGRVIGGGQQRYQGVQPPAPRQDSTLEVLARMAKPVLERKLQEEQQVAFSKGMQRVAMGEAYKDIKGEDSFLSNIFGPTATAQGAAAMAKIKGLDDFQAQMYQDMQGNASMSPDQFRQHAVDSMSKFLTGDETVDASIQAKMVENLPPLMRAQAKANYAWTQQQSINEFNGMLQAAGDKFAGIAAQRAQGLLNNDEFEIAKLDLLRSVQPVAGMSNESYKKALMDSAVLAMNKGNMWVDRVMQQTGMYNGLDVDDQTKIMSARSTAQNKLVTEYGFNKYGAAIGELVGGAAGRSPAQNHAMANQINQRFMDETGSERGILTLKDMISMDRSTYSRMYRMQDKITELNVKANLDAQAEGRLALQTAEMMQTGKGNYAVGAGVPRAKVDASFSNLFDSKVRAGDAEGALDFASDNYSHGNAYINPQLQGTLLEPFRQITAGAVPGPEFDRTMQMLEAWEARPESGAAIDAYLGAENRVKLTRYRQALVALNGDKQAAAKAAWGTPVVKGPSLTSADMKPLMVKQIADHYQGKGMLNSISRWFSGVPDMTPTGQDIVLNAVKNDASIYMNNLGMSPEAAINRALKGAGQQKVDVLGQFAYTKEPNQQPLAALVGTDDNTMAKIMPGFLQEMARKQGIAVNIENAPSKLVTPPGQATPWTNQTDLTNMFGLGKADVSLLRSRDGVGPDGKPYGIFSGYLTRDEKSAQVNFTSNDIKAYYEKIVKERNDLQNVLKNTGL